MDLVKLISGSIAFGGAAMGAVIAAVSVSAQKTTVPRGSLLETKAEKCEFLDSFEVSMPLDRLPTKYKDKLECSNESIELFAKAFFCSPLFQFERKILGLAVPESKNDSDAEIAKLKFVKGDKITMFTVDSRSPYEILLDWGHGYTWLGITPTEFNNSKTTVKLHLGSAITSVPTFVNLLLPSHYLYSKLLLVSARYKLQNYNLEE